MRLEQLIGGNDEIQKHVAAYRAKQGLRIVSPMAREAINKEVLPQIEESVIGKDSLEEILVDTKRAIEAGFSAKTPMYTRLVNYKSIDQSDEQFLEDVLYCMDEWGRKVRALLEEKRFDRENEQESKGEGDPSVNVNVNTDVDVNVDGRKVSPSSDDNNDSEDEETEDAAPSSPEEMFNLSDVRL